MRLRDVDGMKSEVEDGKEEEDWNRIDELFDVCAVLFRVVVGFAVNDNLDIDLESEWLMTIMVAVDGRVQEEIHSLHLNLINQSSINQQCTAIIVTDETIGETEIEEIETEKEREKGKAEIDIMAAVDMLNPPERTRDQDPHLHTQDPIIEIETGIEIEMIETDQEIQKGIETEIETLTRGKGEDSPRIQINPLHPILLLILLFLLSIIHHQHQLHQNLSHCHSGLPLHPQPQSSHQLPLLHLLSFQPNLHLLFLQSDLPILKALPQLFPRVHLWVVPTLQALMKIQRQRQRERDYRHGEGNRRRKRLWRKLD